jgi:hypothetical protein
VLEKYQVDATGTQLYQLNHAITSGVEEGIFVQPKGPSGKVKLAPKASAKDTKEVCFLLELVVHAHTHAMSGRTLLL